MGLRAIPASRMLAAYVEKYNATFTFAGMEVNGEIVAIEPIVVFSPAMYLPAVIAQAEAKAIFQWGSADVLGVKRTINELGVLGVECDVMPIDGSAQGILRGLLLAQAAEQVFNLISPGQSSAQVIDLSRATAYYRSEGAAAVRGECADVLIGDVSSYNRDY